MSKLNWDTPVWAKSSQKAWCDMVEILITLSHEDLLSLGRGNKLHERLDMLICEIIQHRKKDECQKELYIDCDRGVLR